MTYFHGLHALVTGGTGSVGKAVVSALLDHGIASITIMSRDEMKQYEMLLDDRFNTPKIKFMIGDVRDYETVKRAVSGKNLVFHCAAMKHVPFCEHDVSEAIKTNVLGALNVANAASDEESVSCVVVCSTDKACNPTTTMGTTKLLQERVFQNAKVVAMKRFVCVRFGNLLESRGSVFHRFVEQRADSVIYLTHPNMTRFVSTLDEAAKTMIFAVTEARHGDIVIHCCPAIKMIDVATIIAPNAKIEIVGVRQNEKFDEHLYNEVESLHVKKRGEFFVISQQADYTEKVAGDMQAYSAKENCVDFETTRKIVLDFCKRCRYVI